MPNASNIKDTRPHIQDEAAGFKALNDLFGNDAELLALLLVLLANDGTPNARVFARATGYYTFSGGVYTLQKQSANIPALPATIVVGVAGQFTINFGTSLPESTYDVQLTPAKNSSSQAAAMQYSTITHSTSQLAVFTFVAGSPADLDGFTITIFWGT